MRVLTYLKTYKYCVLRKGKGYFTVHNAIKTQSFATVKNANAMRFIKIVKVFKRSQLLTQNSIL